MKYLSRQLANFFLFFSRFGFIGLYALLFQVYWTQDAKFKNRGWDLCSIRKPSGFYLRGTYWEKMRIYG